jgi:hypothetical protein
MGIARSTYYDNPAASVHDTALIEMMVTISESFEAYPPTPHAGGAASPRFLHR